MPTTVPTSSPGQVRQLGGHATKAALRAGLGLIVIATALSLASNAPGAARAACTTVQLTDANGGFTALPSVSGDGTHVAFRSNRDHAGDNPDGNTEIFLHDTTAGTTTQLTDTTSASSSNPSTTGDGTRIAFESTADHTGDNPDGNTEIFLHDTTAGTTTQLTDTTSASSSNPSTTGDGTRIAFESTADHTGDNPDGNTEIFLHDTTAGTTTQLTDTTSASSFSPSTSADGTRIVFISDADHTGDNADGTFEVFLHDTTTGPDGATTQLTDTIAGNSFNPSTSADGTRIAFISDADHTGDNADGNTEIFLHDTTDGPDGTTTQLTDTIAGSSFSPSTSADGTRIAFDSNADLTGDNPDGSNEIFLHDTTVDATTQLTDTSGSSFDPSISADGTRIALRSNADHTGENPDGGDEIFFATCGSPTPSFNDVGLAHPFFAEIEWLAEVEVTGGFPDGGYHPAAPVTRQAMAAFMFRLAGQPPFDLPAEPSFGDVSAGHPFFAEIEWLAEVEVTGGFPDGGYHPAAPVTRQAMAAFMFRLAGQPPFDLPAEPSFGDVSAGHPFFAEIEWLAEVEVTGGFPDGGYHPAAPVSRQAMAAFMFRLADGPGVDLAVT